MHAFRRWPTSKLHSPIQHTEKTIYFWDRNMRRAVCTPILNQAVQYFFSCFTLSSLTLLLFQSSALPSPLLLSTALSPAFYPPLPPCFTSRQGMWDELMQYTASPKGSWDFYCKDLIDWCLRPDSPFPFTLAGVLSVSLFSFTLSHRHTCNTHKVKLCLGESSLAVEVIKKPTILHDFSPACC